MATVEENYKEVFGTDPSPELKNRLNLIKNKLQIDDNDSLWILFMGVGYLNEMYAKIPKLINSQIKNLKSISFKHLCSLCSLVILCILIFLYQTFKYNNLVNELDYNINENKILIEQLVKLNKRLDLIENNYKNLNNYYNNNNNNYGKNNSLSNPTTNTNSNQYNNIIPSPNNYNNNNNYRQDNSLSNPTINIAPNKYNNIFPNPNTNNNFNNR